MNPSRFLSSLLVIAFASVDNASAAADKNWGAYFGDAGGTHYSTLRQIDVSNVARLEKAWEFRTGDMPAGNRSQIQCNPLVIDGVFYGTSPALALIALDAATGRELWRFIPETDVPGGGPAGVNRGLAWWQEGGEKRILFSAGVYLYAVNPVTGKAIASFGDGGRVNLTVGLGSEEQQKMYFAANTPGAVFRDLIIMPFRVGEGPAPSAPGHLRAYDVRTGKQRWVFHTIPQPGEFGYDTWPADAHKWVGGGNCWAGLVIDHERGIAFVPTGSAAFDFYGGDRVGANLFSNCLLALDAATGKRKWHFQFVHHDVWDRDPPAAPVLCEVMRDGKKIAAVAQTLKSGHVWVFDRETGESLFPWREVPMPKSELGGEVTWLTQPFPDKPAPFARQVFTQEEVTNRTPAAREAVFKRLYEVNTHRVFDPPSERGTVIFPGYDGGAEWGGAAVDPKGVLFVNSNEMAWILTMVKTENLGAGAHGLYQQLCMSCHGPNREGNAAQNIPSLAGVGAKLKQEDIIALLRTGKGVMPSFNFIPDPAKEALAQYLVAPDAAVQSDARAGEAAASLASVMRTPWGTTGYNRFFDPDGYPAVRPPWGTLNAIDLNTGEYVWKRTLGELPELTAQGIAPTGTENYGGPVVTAGGVLFIGATKDEKFRAFSTATGELLWETTLPAGGYATPATYEAGGRQYVVIAAGGGKMGTKSGDAWVAFALPKQ